MKAVIIPAVVLSGLLTLGWIASLAVAQAPKDGAAAQPSFSDKIVIISFKSDTAATATLEKVQVTQLVHQKFLVGKAVDDGTALSWTKGQTTWVALDDVAQIVEFPDVETMKKAIKSYSDEEEIF